MASRVRKIRRRPADDELIVEQTQDLAGVASLFAAAGIPPVELDGPGHCCLAARLGSRLVGAAHVRTRVDAAAISRLVVDPAMRGQGIGTALLGAARAAAHTRGTRSLYALAPAGGADFWSRHGFTAIPITAEVVYLAAGPRLTGDAASAGCTAWLLDISGDGIRVR